MVLSSAVYVTTILWKSRLVWYTQIEKIKQYPYDMGKVCPLNDGTSNLMLTTRRSQFICVINLSKSNMIYRSKTKLMQHNVFSTRYNQLYKRFPAEKTIHPSAPKTKKHDQINTIMKLTHIFCKYIRFSIKKIHVFPILSSNSCFPRPHQLVF